jgi:hypothetical protein
MKNPKREKLLPCPFDGGAAGLSELPPSVRFRFSVRCLKCAVQTPWTKNQGEAVTIWNRRKK